MGAIDPKQSYTALRSGHRNPWTWSEVLERIVQLQAALVIANTELRAAWVATGIADDDAMPGMLYFYMYEMREAMVESVDFDEYDGSEIVEVNVGKDLERTEEISMVDLYIRDLGDVIKDTIELTGDVRTFAATGARRGVFAESTIRSQH